MLARAVIAALLALAPTAGTACETAWCPPEPAVQARPEAAGTSAPSRPYHRAARRSTSASARPARPAALSVVTPRAYADALARYRYLTGPRLLTAAGEPLRSPTVTRAELRGFAMMPIPVLDVRDPADFNEIDAAAVEIVEVDEWNELDRAAPPLRR